MLACILSAVSLMLHKVHRVRHLTAQKPVKQSKMCWLTAGLQFIWKFTGMVLIIEQSTSTVRKNEPFEKQVKTDGIVLRKSPKLG